MRQKEETHTGRVPHNSVNKEYFPWIIPNYFKKHFKMTDSVYISNSLRVTVLKNLEDFLKPFNNFQSSFDFFVDI